MDLNSASNNSTLPTLDQIEGLIGQPGTTGTPTSTGGKSVGGSTTGVSTSKGALDAVGVNSLIVDTKVQSAMSASGLSGMSMNAESVLGAAPANIDAQSMKDSLGKVAGDLEHISKTTEAFVCDVRVLAGSSSAEGKIKGDGKTDV